MKQRESTFHELQGENPFQVTRFQPGADVEWDRFVARANNGTIFHLRRFLSYHPGDRFDDHSLVFQKEDRWVSVLPAAVRVEDGIKTLISHPGASMAGPVFQASLSLRDAFCVVERTLAYAKQTEIDAIRLTLPPLIYHQRPGNYFDFALLDAGFSYQRREVSSVIPLDFSEDDTLFFFSEGSRRAVRRGLKLGIRAHESDDYPAFYEILKKNLHMRHNVQPTHSLEELLCLRDLFPDRIRLFSAFAEDEMVAGIVTFACNENVALAFYISHKEEKQEYRGVNVLFYEVVQWAIRSKFKFLDFGIFTVNMKPNWGLARFKESFGAHGVFRDTLYKEL